MFILFLLHCYFRLYQIQDGDHEIRLEVDLFQKKG